MQTKKEYIQNAIVRAATEEFLTYGFAGSSMRRMAQNAGTGMSNFYNYFRSKDDLFAFLVEDRAKAIHTLFDRLLAEDYTASFQTITEHRALLYNLRRWTTRFDILYNRETLLLLTEKTGALSQETRMYLTDSMTEVLLKLAARDRAGRLPDRYPLRHFVSQLLNNMLETALSMKEDPEIKEILRNQLVTAVAGFYLLLN